MKTLKGLVVYQTQTFIEAWRRRAWGLMVVSRLVEELRESKSRLKTELMEHKLLKESIAVVLGRSEERD
ncbi:hypothetical protein Fmac_002600 [Flemingia macrophylla]|uniref:Uncharacterized protein n=1 Tax=Flemingia macrophylla TaxID=520843 RepID=A0ABD1NKD5_9FABA